MLAEIRVKVKRRINGRARKRVETFLYDMDLFSDAEYEVLSLLKGQFDSGEVEEYEIQSVKLSSIKEVADQYKGGCPYIITLKDVWTNDEGVEKSLRYKVLLWADSLKEAAERAHELQKEGYDMLVEDVRETELTLIKEGKAQKGGGYEER